MRTLLSTILVGVGLLATPALAQQNPWVPSGVTEPIGKLPNGDLPVAQHPWVPTGVYVGNLPNGDPAYASTRVRSGDTGARHPVASQHNPGN
jgi:hypothetical protein